MNNLINQKLIVVVLNLHFNDDVISLFITITVQRTVMSSQIKLNVFYTCLVQAQHLL